MSGVKTEVTVQHGPRRGDFDPLDSGIVQKLLGILSAKCPVFWGLLRTECQVIFVRSLRQYGE